MKSYGFLNTLFIPSCNENNKLITRSFEIYLHCNDFDFFQIWTRLKKFKLLQKSYSIQKFSQLAFLKRRNPIITETHNPSFIIYLNTWIIQADNHFSYLNVTLSVHNFAFLNLPVSILIYLVFQLHCVIYILT